MKTKYSQLDFDQLQDLEKKEMYEFYKEMNAMAFEMELRICNYVLSTGQKQIADEYINKVITIYNFIERQIQLQVEDQQQAPIGDNQVHPWNKWEYFKKYCINQLHINNGDIDKVVF